MSLQSLIRRENFLVLAAAPGDETVLCGGLIAACCRVGRPPFVMVLSDRTGAERQTRAAVRCLGLPADRLLMVGLYDGAIPVSGPVHEAVVRAVTLVMWARDCNVVCGPGQDSPVADRRATGLIADAVRARSGVDRIAYVAEGGWQLDVTLQLAAKQAAMAAHGLAGSADAVEMFVRA